MEPRSHRTSIRVIALIFVPLTQSFQKAIFFEIIHLEDTKMTELLQRAISEIEKLPEVAQDAIAQGLLDDLKDEEAWAAQFEKTTDEQWDKLADMARKDIASGNTLSLDTLFPSKKTIQ